MLDARLAAFRRELELFPKEMAAELGPMVQRLAATLGKLSASYLAGVDPDGFDGVTQRGEYHRLLTSEWLLAEEEPDEFLRRAIMREHLFLRLARREPRGGRRCIVLFDAGPMALGSPRLVHLVALLALHARAAQAGAAFFWGTVQSPEATYEQVETETIRALLRARSALLPERGAVRAALERLDAPQPGDDVWWVGDESLRAFAEEHGGSRIEIVDTLCEAGDELGVTVSVGARRHDFRLQLPAEAARAQLIRNPFERVPVPTPLSGRSRDLRFSACGRRLMVRSQGGVDFHHVQNRGPAPSFEYRPPTDSQLLAVNWARRKPVGLVYDGRRYLLHVPGGPLHEIEFEQFPPEMSSGELGDLFLTGRHRRFLIFRDNSGVVFTGLLAGDRVMMSAQVDRCVRLIWRRNYLDYVRHTPDQTLAFGRLTLEGKLVAWSSSGVCTQPPRVITSLTGPHQRVRAVGFQAPASESGIESEAARAGFERWGIHDGSSKSVDYQNVRETLEVVGLIPASREPGSGEDLGWAFLALSEDRRQLVTDTPTSSRVLTSFSDPVTMVFLADSSQRIACESGGGIFVIDVSGGQVRSLPSLERSARASAAAEAVGES